MTDTVMTCGVLDERLADFLEGDLDARARQAVESHIATCARCAALVRELRAIAHDARTLAPLAPSRDLWSGIASGIEAEVIALPARGGTARWATSSTSRRMSSGALAAGLVAITAGATYLLTMTFAVDGNPSVATAPRVAGGDTAQVITAVIPVPVSPASGVDSVSAAPAGVPRERVAASGVSTRLVRRVRPSAEQTYDREIASLRAIVTQRRGDIDPRTAAIVDNSLQTIDRAIAEARGALQRDPASRFLNEQLNKSLEKKLDLLRTAALLPSRTS